MEAKRMYTDTSCQKSGLDTFSIATLPGGRYVSLARRNIRPSPTCKKEHPPAPGIWCGDSDYTWVSGWYPAATELTILKGMQNLLVFRRF